MQFSKHHNENSFIFATGHVQKLLMIYKYTQGKLLLFFSLYLIFEKSWFKVTHIPDQMSSDNYIVMHSHLRWWETEEQFLFVISYVLVTVCTNVFIPDCESPDTTWPDPAYEKIKTYTAGIIDQLIPLNVRENFFLQIFVLFFFKTNLAFCLSFDYLYPIN